MRDLVNYEARRAPEDRMDPEQEYIQLERWFSGGKLDRDACCFLLRIPSDALAIHIAASREEMRSRQEGTFKEKLGEGREEREERAQAFRLDTERWSTYNVKTRAARKFEMHVKFFDKVAPIYLDHNTIKHKSILRDYPFLVAYIYRTLTSNAYQKTAGARKGSLR
jgi:hypothetical protein